MRHRHNSDVALTTREKYKMRKHESIVKEYVDSFVRCVGGIISVKTRTVLYCTGVSERSTALRHESLARQHG